MIDMIPTRVTAATEYPVSLSDMKLHLRVDGSSEDDLIGAYMTNVADAIGSTGELGLGLCSETWSDEFQSPARDVYLSMNPVQSITSISYYDEDHATQSADLADFRLIKDRSGYFIRSDDWPTTADRPDAIKVVYVCGHASAADIQGNIKQAFMLIVAQMYEHRTDASEVKLHEMPRAAKDLLGLSRVGWYG